MERNKKRFDAVALMRKIRDNMSRDIGGMTYEEQKQYMEDRVRLKKKETIGGDEDRITSD